ncbi:MAG: hypothetical protein ACLUD0_07285 [Eubacterium ramulus]
MNANTIGMLIIMIIYLGVMVLIGVLFSRKNNDTSDFYLGGRKLGPVVTAMSAEASDIGGWLRWVCRVSHICPAVLKQVGPPSDLPSELILTGSSLQSLRRYSHKQTIPLRSVLFANRYRDKSNSLLAISAIMIVIFFVPLHRIRIRSRQTVCHTVRRTVYACHDRKMLLLS